MKLRLEEAETRLCIGTYEEIQRGFRKGAGIHVSLATVVGK